ncbi:hypothetical protein ScPMuIL_016237 [Solemya velum]
MATDTNHEEDEVFSLNEEEEEEESGSDESEEEIEPKLKYERIGNDLTRILSKDAASCMAVHTKFLALGTHWGIIHILDHTGNNIRDKELLVHTTTVNQISIDDNGDNIASCSDDGRVIITGLFTTDNNQNVTFDRPVKAVALDPMFYKSGSGKHYVTGDDKLILNEKGFLNRNKKIELHQGEGPIRNIKWRGDFIAWANDYGVKIYDMISRSRITFITKDHDLRPDLYRCHLCWKDNRTLLLGWGTKIKICVVKDRQGSSNNDLPGRYVEIIGMFSTDIFICGIAPLGENVVLLSCEKDSQQQEGGKLVASRPHLQIIKPCMDDYEEISNDALSIRGFQEYRSNDYHLAVVESLGITGVKQQVVVNVLNNRTETFQTMPVYVELQRAMSAAVTHDMDLKKHNFQEIGRRYLNFLLEEQRFDDAAQLCVKILGKNKDLWETEVYKFTKIKQLKAIAPYLPRIEPQLSPAIYEMVLNEFILTDCERFLQLVKEWPHNLYNIQTIVNAVLDRLDRDKHNKILLQTLGELYSYERAFDKALAIYLRLQHKDVFKLIYKHKLFSAISDKIEQLMQFDQEQAVTMLIDNIDSIPMEKVVHQLEKSREFLHVYLDKLFTKDPDLSKEYHGHQVKLYAEFNRSRLLPFLRSSKWYKLQMAMEECEVRDFIPEQVYLLGRMGNTKQALQLITERLKDVNQAIEFCKEMNDPDLWEHLISYSIDKPTFITELLHNIGTHVDPIILIEQIQEKMEIPGLRDSLVKILQDYNLQISLREGCRKILVADSFHLLERIIKTQRRGLSVDNHQTCHICQQRILVNDLRYVSNVIVFYCKHAFHEDCLPSHSMENCVICTTQRRGPGSKPSPK